MDDEGRSGLGTEGVGAEGAAYLLFGDAIERLAISAKSDYTTKGCCRT